MRAYLCCVPFLLAVHAQIRASIQASWNEAPLLVQILESISLESEDAFWSLLGPLSTRSNASTSPRQVYENALSIISESAQLGGIGSLSALKLSLANKEASPKIQAFYEYYNSIDKPNQYTCNSWVHYNQERLCDLSRLQSLLEDATQSAQVVEPLPFDHVYPSSSKRPIFIFYADPLAADFARLHDTLTSAAQSKGISYILRWKPSLTHAVDRLVLSGYGASLDIKKADYLAVDDRQISQESSNKIRKSPVDSTTVEFGDENAFITTLSPLTRSELSDIGDKAVQFVMATPNPLSTLVHLVQNFPKYAHQLVSDWVPSVSEEVAQALLEQRNEKIQPGQNAVWLNGLLLTERDMEPFSLLRIMRQERKRVQRLMSFSLTAQQAVEVLSYPAYGNKQSSGGLYSGQGPVAPEHLGQLFDASDRPEDNLAIIWWNDLERDRRYRGWPKELQELLRPSYPGQLAQVGRNLWNLVFVLDLSKRTSATTVVEYIMPFVQRSMPFHMGLVSLVDTDDAIQMTRILLYVLDNFTKTDAMSMFLHLSELTKETLSLQDMSEAYQAILRKNKGITKEGEPAQAWDEIAQSHARDRLAAMKAYSTRLGLDNSEGYGHLFINGRYAAADRTLQRSLQNAISLQQTYVQQQIYFRKLVEEADVANLFYDLSTTHSRRNKLIFEDERNPLKTITITDWQCPTEWLIDTHTREAVASVYVVAPPHSYMGDQARHFAASTQNARVCLLERLPNILESVDVPGGSGSVIVNSRILHISSNNFAAEDFQTLVNYEMNQRILPVAEALEAANVTDLFSELGASLLASATTIVAQAYLRDPTAIFESGPMRRSRSQRGLANQYTTINLGISEASWAFFEAAIDPISETAQRWTALLETLSGLDGVSITTYLNPPVQLKELPVKQFYRQAFPRELAFDSASQQEKSIIAFEGMPRSVLLTLGLITHPSWVAFPSESIHDLDNIRLNDIGATSDNVEALFELENIIIEGHCSDTTNGGQAPRGLQLELRTYNESKVDSSIVMANLGYVQLQANPGLYTMAIREEGRGRDVFQLQTSKQLAVTSFEGTVQLPSFTRQPGMDLVDLLDENESSSVAATDSVLARWTSTIQSFFGKSKSVVDIIPSNGRKADINVFTVASGLLYERMAFIMIVSVLRHTKSSVKFWFIANFLSPSFKTFIPHMAEEYGFDYELVTYKWPHWLRAQKEKQRAIWGYKILFLDVLFPLELERVIFVDSDQIVRADLKELVNLDLQGAPYAYAPMGNDRAEMEGFRFWKTGYWREHLRGRPYHISALYVVDLERFRQIAAGDRLRGQYQALSADPNSLANLDQDLPNNMQNQIPIYTLDPSWLWCETWCSDESLAAAKTIDLVSLPYSFFRANSLDMSKCNNPMTHEPKLDRAKRLIPEWTVYDAEIAELAHKVALADQAGTAFEGDATRLGQAKLQQEEFVVEGTGSAEAVSTDASERLAEREQERETRNDLLLSLNSSLSA